MEALELVDDRRRVSAHDGQVRMEGQDVPEGAWLRWRTGRDELFPIHPRSPAPAAARGSFAGMAFHPSDHRWRAEVEVEPLADVGATPVPHIGPGPGPGPGPGGGGWVAVERVTPGGAWGGRSLDLLWPTTCGGGLSLSFRDRSSGTETSGGRYLIDTSRGADLGTAPSPASRPVPVADDAYHPSCAHHPRWSCPLASASNALDVAVAAGELLPVHARGDG